MPASVAPSYPPPPGAPAAPSPYPPPPIASAPTPGGLRSLGTGTEVLLWVAGAMSLVGVLVSILARRAHLRVRDGTGTLGHAASVADRWDATFGVWGLVFLVSAVLFVVWLHRSGSLARHEGRTGTWSPGWAVGAWFIPLANLVLPFLYVHELWRMSDPEVVDVPPGSWRRSRTTPLLWAWWTCFCAAGILLTVALGQTDDQTAAADAAWLRQYGLAAVAYTAYAGAGVLGALLVRAMTRRLVALAEGPSPVVVDPVDR